MQAQAPNPVANDAQGHTRNGRRGSSLAARFTISTFFLKVVDEEAESMSRGKINPKRPKRPKLPEKCTLMDCVRWVMYAQNCSEDEAKREVKDAIASGRLSFGATVSGPGMPAKSGQFRFRNGPPCRGTLKCAISAPSISTELCILAAVMGMTRAASS